MFCPPRILQSSLQNTISIYEKKLCLKNWPSRAGLLIRLKNLLQELKDIVIVKVFPQNENVG